MPIAYDDRYVLRPGHKVDFTREMIMEVQKCAMDIMYFAENYYTIVHPKKGKMLIQLYDFQKDMIECFKNNRRSIILSGRQLGKALSLDTPILCKNGWSNINDLKKGDIIYGQDGEEATVTFITDVMNDKDVYEIEFDNGEKIKACSEHLWNVSTSGWQRSSNKVRTVSTEEIIDIHNNLQSRSKPASVFIETPKPIHFKHQDTPIHPYLLGLWLGDGNKNDGRISCHIDDYYHYKKKLNDIGYEVSDFRLDKRTESTGAFNVVGLAHLLRENGLWKNKHIPEVYIRNSIDNRLHIIQGLMDSDGYCAKKGGTCQFYQCNFDISDKFRFILSTLGIKTRLSEKKKNKKHHKQCYIVTFSTDLYKVFSLQRKLERQSKTVGHKKNSRFYIRNIRKIDSEPVRCLQVDNDDHMFLCGNTLIPTHNTTCSCIYLLWFSIFNADKEVAILANKQSTAGSIVSDIKTAYELLPAWIKPGVKKYDSLTIEFDNGTKVYARATSPDALRGESVSLMFLDEFGFVPENMADEFWASQQPTLSTGGSCIIVSTPNGACGLYYELWKKAQKKNSGWGHLKITWDCHPDRDEKWKEETISDIGKVKFFQEHQCSFTGSSYTLIDGDVLQKLQPVDPPYYPEEGYYMWKRPEPGHLYAIGVDVAKGAGSDYHVMNIYDVTKHHLNGKYEQVALYRRNDISVFDFKDKILEIAPHWFNPVVIVENNDLGHAVVHELYFEEGYENTYYDYDKGEYGVRSTSKTKALALAHFREDIEEWKMKINSSDMITELGYYEEVRTGVFQARNGRGFHDDTVASGYWVSYLLRSRFWEDYLDWWLKNNDPRSQEMLNILNNEASQKDAEVADGFLSALGSGGNPDAYVDDFINELRMG